MNPRAGSSTRTFIRADIDDHGTSITINSKRRLHLRVSQSRNYPTTTRSRSTTTGFDAVVTE